MDKEKLRALKEKETPMEERQGSDMLYSVFSRYYIDVAK